MKNVFHTIFKDKTKCLNAEIPEGTTVQLLLTDKEGKETKLNFDCTETFYLGKQGDIIGNFKAK